MHFASIHELSHLFKTRQVSPVEITTALLDRISSIGSKLHCYTYVMAESALRAARKAEEEITRGEWRGPLHGVPLGVKDQFWTAEGPTAAGTLVLRQNMKGIDSTIVRRLHSAGAVLLGKHSMAEAAFGDHHPANPPAINPWDEDTWPGSSSSGSGVATAAGLCYGAVATDTGGSIRFPSNANGLTGLKPTWGRVSGFGIEGCARGAMDHAGPMARSAYDCAIILQAIAGPDENDPAASLSPVPDYTSTLDERIDEVRIGVDGDFNSYCDGPTLAVLQESVDLLKTLGAVIVEARIPDVSKVVDDWKAACAIDLALAHEQNFPSRSAEYSREIAALLSFGRSHTALDLQRIQQEQRRFKGSLEALFQRVDVLLVPVLGVSSPTNAQMSEIGYGPDWKKFVMRATCPFNVSGHPALAMPAGFTARRTPMGVQLVGPGFSEDLLLRLAHAFQTATDYHTRHPAL